MEKNNGQLSLSFNSLDEAKQYVQEHKEKGTTCPCCGQFAKIYKRKITSTMAKMLVNLYKRENKIKPITHYSDLTNNLINKQSGDFAKLRFWDLIEKVDFTDPTGEKKSSGYWRITPLGKQFVEKKVALIERVHVFDNEVIKTSGAQVFIDQCFKTNFDYTELMNA